jgi:hypothetical protein
MSVREVMVHVHVHTAKQQRGFDASMSVREVVVHVHVHVHKAKQQGGSGASMSVREVMVHVHVHTAKQQRGSGASMSVREVVVHVHVHVHVHKAKQQGGMCARKTRNALLRALSGHAPPPGGGAHNTWTGRGDQHSVECSSTRQPPKGGVHQMCGR